MELCESDERRDLRAAVAAIARSYGHEYYLSKSLAGEKSTELWREIGKQGFLGVNIAEEYGGGGGGIYELHAVGEELAAAGCPLLMTVVSPAICGTIIQAFGSEEQKQRWLPGIASGDMIMAFAITEPDAGSNSHNIATTATRDGDEWVLRGTKYYISGVDEAQAVLVVTRTGTDERGRGQLSLVVVPTDAAGLQKTLIPVQAVTPEKQFTLFFDDVRVPAENLVGEQDEGLRQVFMGLNPERIMGAALSTGIGRYALDKACAYARERQVWNTPIGAHQGVAHPLAHAKIQVELARLMTQRAAELHDAGNSGAGEAANMAKYAAAEAGILALDQAIQTHGGNGMATEYGLATLWGPARLMRTAPISREMILNFVAQHSLGLPKSY
ncbi:MULTISPECIES: acyl-CoA dehydrogenase family protein [Mycobacteriaceae]|jgi:alkylation response protein AidB-like acyl-CoA dehydrogenase|uniref:Acyl-CoA dehydrogenase n=6 Tax=Mycobacteriaceae TaxID=1762 RepID=A0A132PEF5_9MYCO|nr:MULTISPECIES: acyl-CoA dehydrogenase [Mycobacteriaceae]KLI04325.1 acyl-CoA dehydrogenase [Mycolicibacterium senegalense]KLO47502.1 acyl-CoA dehydrogenase [Mycolicibacterium senegalense]KWX20710.1 acyl-CoA dehydrogenase [Mycolicibacterium wolinskyi]MCG7608294.1 acyl-CoA dehydrogenase [Mycobacterium sp. CnD-18-1]MCQ4362273.1 acyl-CoA dehydrogenase [Mycobacterium gordonae]